MTSSVGLDFGTTNSSVAITTSHGVTRLARFSLFGALTESYRSLIYLENSRTSGRFQIHAWTGPAGIEHYLQAETKGRLIQSLKSFLASRTLESTNIFGRKYKLESLIATILRDIRVEAERQFGFPIRQAVVGRPVRFASAERLTDDDFATSRLRAALDEAGFEHVSLDLEPVAAAYYYESTLDHDELIVIGDFGGGTSDFSLLRVGPTAQRDGHRRDLLRNEGVAVAGDAFDAKIIRHLVSPALGAGTSIRSVNKILPVPMSVYFKLERWHHLSFLKSHEVIDMLRAVRNQAFEPRRIEALLHLIQQDLGYQLHQAVQKAKCTLSEQEVTTFEFSDGDVHIEAPINRREFESWIAEELSAIERCVDRLLSSAGVSASDVDMVFLTGGSSFVPAVRRIFETRFGRERIRSGHEFTSVAQGLSLMGALQPLCAS